MGQTLNICIVSQFLSHFSPGANACRKYKYVLAEFFFSRQTQEALSDGYSSSPLAIVHWKKRLSWADDLQRITISLWLHSMSLTLSHGLKFLCPLNLCPAVSSHWRNQFPHLQEWWVRGRCTNKFVRIKKKKGQLSFISFLQQNSHNIHETPLILSPLTDNSTLQEVKRCCDVTMPVTSTDMHQNPHVPMAEGQREKLTSEWKWVLSFRSFQLLHLIKTRHSQ